MSRHASLDRVRVLTYTIVQTVREDKLPTILPGWDLKATHNRLSFLPKPVTSFWNEEGCAYLLSSFQASHGKQKESLNPESHIIKHSFLNKEAV